MIYLPIDLDGIEQHLQSLLGQISPHSEVFSRKD